ncbi:MAG: hypothetical protein MRY76_00115 [Pseudomonadales bacterium]|nr:hypothetical protein [Pseudomonadales bacterium]
MTESEFTYDIDQHRNLVAQHAEGKLDLGTLESVTSRVTEDKNFQPGMNCLTDIRQSTPTESDQSREQSENPGGKAEFHKHAILARTRSQVGLARNYEARCQANRLACQIVVFRDEADALDWLKD